ncbi:MAG: cysteine desulfurase [Clostridia bacterium]|nr:cysteine desulfurase [Clostridia bacterium]
MRRVYLDHSATTPVRSEVLDAMLPFLKEDAFGNPSSIYSYGREAKKAMEEAREKVANLIGAEPEEIFFTSGGTEADNMALMGTVAANEKKGRHIITSSIEHHAILNTAQYLKKKGFKVTFLPVTKEGLVQVEDIKKAITDETVLISVMHVNNEVGTIQPIKEIGALAKEHGITFHTDAVQSVGKIPVNVDDLNADLLSISGHKIYGPKGIGCIYIRKGTKINPILFGGAQERTYRPGTENMPGIVGFGRAAELAAKELDSEMERIKSLRDKLIEGIKERIPDVQLNGDLNNRVAINANFAFSNVEGESLLLSMDMKGICASSGSACSSGSVNPSHVLLAMGIPPKLAEGSVRFTLGRDNTEEDIDYVLENLPQIVEHLRSISAF